ncbi:MAG: hypothetical protein OES25_02620 [Acidobacteriota bacterium]|nr:hypothetical protein [Acidobacteriota bacterium]
MIRRVTTIGLLSMLFATGLPVALADEEAARKQFRIARRLVAEGSSQAVAALERVIEVDPKGPLADDAALERVLLIGVPRSVDETGRLTPASVNEARGLLTELVRKFPAGDRVAEARYLLGLLALEPVPGFDTAAAKLDLLDVATDGRAGPWRGAARLTIARLAALEGDYGRAADATQRLLADEGDHMLRGRARLAWARYRLREGGYGEAAATLQELLDDESLEPEVVQPLRDMAMRALLGRTPDLEQFERVVIDGRYRSEDGIALRQGKSGDEIIVLDRRQHRVLTMDRDGRVQDQWTVDDPHAVSTTDGGRIFVAAGNQLIRLDDEGLVVPVGFSGDWGPVSRLAADGLGGLYLIGRRSTTIGYLAPGASVPEPFASLDSMRNPFLAWDGRSLLLLDPKSRQLHRIRPDGQRQALGMVAQTRPQGLAIDGAGRIVILDGRNRSLGFYTAGGQPWNTLDLEMTELQRPGQVMISADGSVHLFDDANGVWGRLP